MTMVADRPLRVGFDISKSLGVPDGIARYTELLLSGLLECDPSVRYTLFDLTADDVDEARLTQMLGSRRSDITVADRRYPNDTDVDVFHSPAITLPPGRPCPIAWTLHDVTFLSHPNYHTIDNRVASLSATALAACRASAIVAVSDHSKAAAVELLDLPPERIEVIHSAADPFFSPLPHPERKMATLQRLGIDRPYVLAVGSLEPRKNLIRLVDAMLQLPAEVRAGLSLVTAGPSGWKNRPIHDRLEQASAELSIRQLGVVTRSDLALLYSCAEAFVYPSFAEGFGLPVLEAMACGAPVVTSNCSALPEVAGDAALLVDPEDADAIADAISRVVGDRALGDDLGQRSLARARDFSWQRTAEQTLALYRHMAHR